jgi:hypothetical protein
MQEVNITGDYVLYVYICIYIRTYIRTYIYVYMYVYVYIYTYVNIYGYGDHAYVSLLSQSIF